jgi:hypothetical protein
MSCPFNFGATLSGLYLPGAVFARVNAHLLHCGVGLGSSQRGLHVPCKDAGHLERVPQNPIDAGA